MHYLSVLAIFKNETMNLKIWLDHYLWQGATHFFLIDNGSTDEPLGILQEYIDTGIVTYSYQPKPSAQEEHYRNMYVNEDVRNKTYWLAVCDLDEFFYGVNRKLTNKLRGLESYYDYIICNWLMFGSDNNIEHPRDIRTANLHREQNLHILKKYIFKTQLIDNNNVSKIYVHSLDETIVKKNRKRVANQLIRLNHYPIQSLEFFQKVKMTRGDAMWSDKQNIRDMNYFNAYNKNAIFFDETLKNLLLCSPENYLDNSNLNG